MHPPVSRLAIALAVFLVFLARAIALAESADLAPLKQSVIAQYAALAQAGYEDSVAGARSLAQAVDALVAAPSEESLKRARQAWIDSRVSYTQTEAFRFYDGPIETVEGQINSWPIDENLIDYVEGDPGAGVINQPETFGAITTELIVSLNEHGGEKNITAGFHAIEFLLWGQDLNDEGPGQRSHLDYVDGRTPHADRRRLYLQLAARLLVKNLEAVLEEWAPDRPSNYRTRFVAMAPDAALACIFKGVGILSGSELAGERLTVPYETKEQEDEHSCFSDNTPRDLLYNVIGVENVLRGRYTRPGGERIEGRGLLDLLAQIDSTLASRLADQIDATVAAARALPAPFDRAIVGTDSAPGRVAVKRLITALRAQADTIAQAGVTLGLRLNL